MDNALTRRLRAVDLSETDPYIDGFAERHASRARMSDKSDRTDKSPASTSGLTVLEDKIDQLIALCAQLNRENQALKAENLNYQQERRDLIAKNELARARVEATLQRLRSMEAGA